MYDWVYADERWFHIFKDGQGVYLHPTEDTPKPPWAQNTCYITKMMFLAAMVRPRKLSNGVWFDGKIRIWSIVDTKVAQCSSKHRPKGTKVLVPAMVDGGERYKKLVIEDVIPAVKACMPRLEGFTTFIQQDGAKPHTKEGIMKAVEEAVRDDIVMETQSSNSPDLSVNNLGFFHSIQQLKEDVGVTNTEEVVKATMEAFDLYPQETLSVSSRGSSHSMVKCWGPRVAASSKFPILARKVLRMRTSSP
ncbi:unnamed protein product [Choristocarpus tenellus]